MAVTTQIQVIPHEPLESTSTPVIEKNAASLTKRNKVENETTETLYRPFSYTWQVSH
jgi:hypothetical protein